jgi:hypothetical protein
VQAAFSFAFSFAFFCFLFLFLPPTPNPLINAFKPTYCAGWVAFYPPPLLFNLFPWLLILSLLPSVFFRVRPWLMLLLCLPSVANASASAWSSFREIPRLIFRLPSDFTKYFQK